MQTIKNLKFEVVISFMYSDKKVENNFFVCSVLQLRVRLTA
jgi:hypothetical protein